MKYCENCGAPLEENDRFCEACGHIQDELQGQIPERPKKKKKGLIIFVLMFVAAAVTAVLFFGKQSEKTAEVDVLPDEALNVTESTVSEVPKPLTQQEFVNIQGENDVPKEELIQDEVKKELLRPFSEITVLFTGENGSGKLEISGLASEGPMSGYFFEWENDGSLKNGDKVILTYNKEKLEQLFPEYEVTDVRREYIVNGLKEDNTDKNENNNKSSKQKKKESAKASDASDSEEVDVKPVETTPKPAESAPAEPTPSSEPEYYDWYSSKIVYSTVGAINIRKEPTYYSDLVGTVEGNIPMYHYGSEQLGYGSDDQLHYWIYVETNTGLYGWVRSDLTTYIVNF